VGLSDTRNSREFGNATRPVSSSTISLTKGKDTRNDTASGGGYIGYTESLPSEKESERPETKLTGIKMEVERKTNKFNTVTAYLISKLRWSL